MKSAILPRPALRAALNHVKSVVERRNHIPVLANVLIASDGVATTIKGTDLDITMTATIPGAAGDAGLAVTIPAHMLADVEKKAPETESVALDYAEPEEGKDKASASLDFEGMRVSLAAIVAKDFPDMAWQGPTHADFTIATADLIRALSATWASISTEATRYYLNGVFLHAMDRGNRRLLRFVSTDGHRMCVHEIDAPEGVTDGNGVVMPGVIIPRKAIDTVLRVAGAKGAPETARIVVNTTKVRVVIGNIDILTKLVDGTFPDYGRVIPTGNDKHVTVSTDALIKGLKAVSCVASERGRAVRLNLATGKLTLTVVNPDNGTAKLTIPCGYDGPDAEIGFNSRYLTDLLGMIGDKAVISIADPGSPALIRDADDDATLYVLMPMRV